MSKILETVRDVLLLTEKVAATGKALERIRDRLEAHEARIIRLEAKWETAMEIAVLQRGAPQLPPKTDER